MRRLATLAQRPHSTGDRDGVGGGPFEDVGHGLIVGREDVGPEGWGAGRDTGGIPKSLPGQFQCWHPTVRKPGRHEAGHQG